MSKGSRDCQHVEPAPMPVGQPGRLVMGLHPIMVLERQLSESEEAALRDYFAIDVGLDGESLSLESTPMGETHVFVDAWIEAGE